MIDYGYRYNYHLTFRTADGDAYLGLVTEEHLPYMVERTQASIASLGYGFLVIQRTAATRSLAA